MVASHGGSGQVTSLILNECWYGGTTREFLTDFPTYGTPLSSTVRSLNGNHDETEISSHVAHHGPPDGVNTRIIGASRRRWPMVERSRDAGSREG